MNNFLRKKHYKVQLLAGVVAVALNMPLLHAEGSAELNLKGVEITTLIETVSRLTGKNFIVDPRVKGQATVITGRKLTNDELYETFLSVLQVHNLSVVETGGILKVIPSNIAKQETHPIISDAYQQPSEKFVTKLVQVEHVSALSIVSALRPLSRTVQIQHHAESNSVVMSGRAGDLRRLEVIIQRMDRADEKQIEVVPLKYADAKQVVTAIQALNKTGVKGQLSSGNKVSADERTNSLLVTGDKATRDRIRMIAAKLDVPKKKEGNTRVIYLKYAKAIDLVKVLQGASKTSQISNTQGKAASAQNPGGATSGGASSNLDIQADESSNSLIITAEKDVMNNLMQIVRQLDVRRAQVMIETIVAEVSTALSANLGIQFGFNGLAGDDKGPIAVSNFAGAGSNSLLNIATIAATGSGSIGTGALLGVGGTAGGTQFVALLDALASDGATNILSTPTLVTMDNEEAEIVVGQNIPLLTGSFTNSAATGSNPFQTIERKDIGLTLKVTPQINEGTSVKLAIQQEVSSLAASNSSASDLITNKRSITTNVMVEDGEVLVLGGLIENTFRDSQEKVPVLGDLPLVGGMFRHDATTKQKQNLMVFIHPVILRDHMSADVYTRRKYSAIQRKQKDSEILGRGTFKNRAEPLPPLHEVITQQPFKQPQKQQQPRKPVAKPIQRTTPIVEPVENKADYIPFIDDY
ncbi:MAG: General secretion pathway protein D [uncultured Thiotrichaceae bacterium]|uniref:General secretion pathway protein D n=1 Tax=uncultured Thiotrichaceae bacterium TaxID=298394 RepID=A0A6S6U0H0_9GAMM|nr:MAG: General secretion pathway protein D [uncultured Thiotrichaceae bacterium]